MGNAQLQRRDANHRPPAATVDLAAVARAHREPLRGLALKLTRGHRAEADDLVQDTFERALARPAALAEVRDVRAWLGTIVRNLHVDRMRQLAARPSAPMPDDLAAPVDAGDRSASWVAVSSEQIAAALAALAPELRQTYELAAQGVPYPVLAAQLGVPKSTIGTRVLRARRKLRRTLLGALGERGPEPWPA